MGAERLQWHCQLLQDDQRDQHAGLPLARLITKGAHPYIEYDKAALQTFLGALSCGPKLLSVDPELDRGISSSKKLD